MSNMEFGSRTRALRGQKLDGDVYGVTKKPLALRERRGPKPRGVASQGGREERRRSPAHVTTVSHTLSEKGYVVWNGKQYLDYELLLTHDLQRALVTLWPGADQLLFVAHRRYCFDVWSIVRVDYDEKCFLRRR